MRKAGTKSETTPSRSSLDSPKPTTPWPAYRAATRASSAACAPERAQLDDTITPAGAPETADSTVSTTASKPPSSGAYAVGSTWISTQAHPSARLSSSASATTRRMSPAERTAARTAS
jgi:hypothetical protein